MKHVACEEVFDALGWMFDKLSRLTLGNWLSGYAEYHHRDSARRLVARMEREGWIQSSRSGKMLQFRISDKGWARLRDSDPAHGWQRTWDGDWRAITFDVPEKRRKEREVLWRALRTRKLGFLQQSIWVWPHELEPIVRDIIEVEGLPECFFGLTTRRIWLCNDAEVVAGSWDWEKIHRRQQSYLRQATVRIRAAESAATVESLAQVAGRSGVPTSLHSRSIRSCRDDCCRRIMWDRPFRSDTRVFGNCWRGVGPSCRVWARETPCRHFHQRPLMKMAARGFTRVALGRIGGHIVGFNISLSAQSLIAHSPILHS